MKIVYITAGLPYGSGETFIIPEVQELRRRGHELLIVPRSPKGCIMHNDAHNLEETTLKAPLISSAIVAGAYTSLRNAPKDAWLVFGQLCHSRNLKLLIKNLCVYLKGLWLAHICIQWGADHIHVHWASTTATMALIASKVSGIPWSFTAHRWDIKERNLLKIKAQHASFVRAISEKGAFELSELADYPRERIRVIHVGIDLPEFASVTPASKRCAWKDIIKIIVPANLIEVKGHRFLLDAIKDMTSRGLSMTLDIVGDGPLRDKLFNHADALGISDKVTFWGMVPHDELLSRMEQGEWDICVLPSIVTADGVHEGIPVSLMEAMARGVPVISTSSGSIAELLYEEAGLIVPPGDGNALAQAILKLAKDPSLRAAVATKGRERVQKEFDVKTIVDKLLNNM